MRFFAFIAALVIFIITAILAFLVGDITLDTLIGLLAIGLACLTLAMTPAPPNT